MQELYNPYHSILGQILRQEIRSKQIVNEHALIPLNNYFQNNPLPSSKNNLQTYLDIAAGTGILSAKIKDILLHKGHPVKMFTLDLFNNVANPSRHIQANAIQLPFRKHSFDFITMNFGLRYLTAIPEKQMSSADSSLLEETARSHGFDKEPMLYNEFMSKAYFLHDILHRVLKPSGRFVLVISTEAPGNSLNVYYSSLSMIIDCLLAENSLMTAIRRFWQITNPTSIAFVKALYQKDSVAKHTENHYFNSPAVTNALLQHFQGRIISVNATTSLSILEFTALPERDCPQVPIQEEIDSEYLEYALPI